MVAVVPDNLSQWCYLDSARPDFLAAVALAVLLFNFELQNGAENKKTSPEERRLLRAGFAAALGQRKEIQAPRKTDGLLSPEESIKKIICGCREKYSANQDPSVEDLRCLERYASLNLRN